MVWLKDARLPDGLRVYAIGDVHGCFEELASLHQAIAEDLEHRPAADWRIVHVGDYVDRGPDNFGVIDLLAGLAADPRMICLMGNHDRMFLDALDGRRETLATWVLNGGDRTLADYGLDGDAVLAAADPAALLARAVPAEHAAFLGGLALSARFGDYFFVHAGIRPGVPLDAQDPHDLLWIRKEFLADPRPHPAVIVHGHTPVRAVDLQPNRIGIDTGAVFGRTLTCLVLEGADKAVLGRQPLPPAPPATR